MLFKISTGLSVALNNIFQKCFQIHVCWIILASKCFSSMYFVI